MTTKTKSEEEQSAAAAMKELRARDAQLAMREYQQDKLEVQARTERLRALRLARDSEAAQAPPKQVIASASKKTGATALKKAIRKKA
jgi:hypothetical protein